MALVLGLLIAYLAAIFATGIAILHFSGFRAQCLADTLLAAFAAGLSAVGLGVFALLLLNVYYAWVVIGLGLVPIAYLCREAYHRRLSEIAPRNRDLWAGLPKSPFDRAAALVCFSFLIVCIVDCLSSPMTNWDAVVSWDKWATEWALRTNMYDRLLGYYSQLLPMASSLLYKLTGTGREVIPLTQYALHAFQPALGMLLVLAVLRLSALLNVVAWPSLLALFGSTAVRSNMTTGTADLLATTMFVIGLALFTGALNGQFSSRRSHSLIFTIILFGVFFAKTPNLIFVAIPLVTWLMSRVLRRPEFSMPKGMSAAIVAALMLMGCFLIHQYINIQTAPEEVSLSEINFDPGQMAKILTTTTVGALKADTATGRLRIALGRTVDVYEFPASVNKLIFGLAVVGMLLCGLTPRFWPLLITAIIQVAIWTQVTAYDTRNLFPALAPIGLCITRGFSTAFERLPSPRFPKAAFGLIMAPIFFVAAGHISQDTIRVAENVAANLNTRLQAMKSDVRSRMALFYPNEFPAYRFMNSLRPFREAKHIMAGSRMYRWLPNGGYPLSFWSSALLVPGDAYVTLPGYSIPDPDHWTEVYDDGQQRLFLRDNAPKWLMPKDLLLRGQTPPHLVDPGSQTPWVIESTGSNGYAAYNIPARSLPPGASLTWRVVVSGDVADATSLAPAYLAYDPSIIDKDSSRVVIDTTRAQEEVLIYSGIIKFSAKPLSTRLTQDEILVGLALLKPGLHIQINEFRVSLYQ